MKKKLKKAWLKALRSGNYTQTALQLKDSYGYCCLGVLCEVANVTSKVNMRSSWPNENINGNPNPFLGLGKKTQRTLADMNDRRFTFEKIADHIERYIRED